MLIEEKDSENKNHKIELKQKADEAV